MKNFWRSCLMVCGLSIVGLPALCDPLSGGGLPGPNALGPNLGSNRSPGSQSVLPAGIGDTFGSGPRSRIDGNQLPGLVTPFVQNPRAGVDGANLGPTVITPFNSNGGTTFIQAVDATRAGMLKGFDQVSGSFMTTIPPGADLPRPVPGRTSFTLQDMLDETTERSVVQGDFSTAVEYAVRLGDGKPGDGRPALGSSWVADSLRRNFIDPGEQSTAVEYAVRIGSPLDPALSLFRIVPAGGAGGSLFRQPVLAQSTDANKVQIHDFHLVMRTAPPQHQAANKVNMQDFHFVTPTAPSQQHGANKVNMQDFHFVMRTAPSQHHVPTRSFILWAPDPIDSGVSNMRYNPSLPTLGGEFVAPSSRSE